MKVSRRTKGINRREFIIYSGGAIAAVASMSACTNPGSSPGHPRIYLSDSGRSGLRTIEDVRRASRDGHGALLWEGILSNAGADADSPPLQPSTMVPGRDAIQAETNNLDFVICDAAGKRITRNALAYLITDDEGYRSTALAQMMTVLNEWPDWIDQAHLRFEHPAGLRTGMLAFDTSIGFDWLYNSLSEAERKEIIEGLNRKAVQPFLISIGQDPWWMHDLNNWTTTICGGLGVCGMVLHGHHDESQRLIQIGDEVMERYLTQYGPEGEFNENPSYANATLRPVEYFMAHRYYSGGTVSRLEEHPFPHTCYWLKYLTLPPGRTTAFGDAKVDAAPWTKYVAAIAAATNDATLQQYYLDHHRGQTGDPVELLWYDSRLEGSHNPAMPLGRVFPAFGGCISSRTSWDSTITDCVVYGKASREDNHEHHDAGTVCIDGFGERLIVDLGSPSAYPADFFEDARWEYYNAGIVGHNVIMVNQQEMKLPDWERGNGPKKDLDKITGRVVDSAFDKQNGAFWSMDLTNAYRDVAKVTRTVVHLLPGYVAVFDTVQLQGPGEISLRWHTINRARPDADGNFSVIGEVCRLDCQISRIDAGSIEHTGKEHSYREPFDRERTGQLLEQRNESYVETIVNDSSCKLLTLFALSSGRDQPQRWNRRTDGSYALGSVACTIDDESIALSDASTGQLMKGLLV
ncbi:MAG: hypothetical protein HKN43_00670 [Rhodothermales bacterium]|nr:hypothetical protein [Rhodothermales bacterium]